MGEQIQNQREGALNKINKAIRERVADIDPEENPVLILKMGHFSEITGQSGRMLREYGVYEHLTMNYPSITKPKRGTLEIDVAQFQENQIS